MSQTPALLIGLSALALAGPVDGAALRVPTQYPTLWEACDASAYGDTILVAPGSYSDTVVRGTIEAVCFPKAGTTLIAIDGPAATVIEAPVDAYGVLVSDQDGPVSIQGFTFFVRRSGAVWIRYRQAVSVSDCTFLQHESAEGGIAIEAQETDLLVERSRFIGLVGPSLSTYGTVQIRACEFIANQSNGLSHYRGGGVFEMSGCKFLGNAGILFYIDDDDGESHITDNHFEGNFGDNYAFGVSEAGLLLRGNTFVDNEWANICESGGLHIVRIEQNLFWRNRTHAAAFHPRGSNLRVERNAFIEHTGRILYNSSGYIYSWNQNTVAYNAADATLHSEHNPQNHGCNLYWANAGPVFEKWTPSATDIFVAPQFCDRQSGVFEVSAGSPCVPEENSCADWIGPLEAGCGPVSIEASTWARLKSRYR